MEGRNGARSTPVDEVRGEKLDFWERDVAGGGDLGKGFGRA